MSKVFFDQNIFEIYWDIFRFHQFEAVFWEKGEYEGYTLCVNPIVWTWKPFNTYFSRELIWCVGAWYVLW